LKFPGFFFFLFFAAAAAAPPFFARFTSPPNSFLLSTAPLNTNIPPSKEEKILPSRACVGEGETERGREERPRLEREEETAPKNK
jgi:hypothetical protein